MAKHSNKGIKSKLEECESQLFEMEQRLDLKEKQLT